MRKRSIEDLLPKAGGSIYRLICLASKRAVELAEGKPKLVDFSSDKLTTLALEEISEGKVTYKDNPEAA